MGREVSDCYTNWRISAPEVNGGRARVEKDGEDISHLISGIYVAIGVGRANTVTVDYIAGSIEMDVETYGEDA